MNERLKNILLKMYRTDSLDDIPNDTLSAIILTDMLCDRAGGELASRQVIADIIVRTDVEKTYMKRNK